MSAKKIGSYFNGNYCVTIFSDGTKIRENNLDTLVPDKPESIDLKITNQCDMQCPFCHENSKPDGEHARLNDLPFLDTLYPYTEIAIGGGNPLEHPLLESFLRTLREKKLIANITLNQNHFEKEQRLVRYLADSGLIHGIGVSVVSPHGKLLQLLQTYPNAVVHVINGVMDVGALRAMYDKSLNLLILGYKDFRRGKIYHSRTVEERKQMMFDKLLEITRHFKVTSFDNLAVEQLNVKRLVNQAMWEEFYMGDDGEYTMYIDAVKREYSKSSTSTERYPLLDDIKPMFDMVRSGNQ